MISKRLPAAVATLIVGALLTTTTLAQGHVKARLDGYQEVPPISTPAHGAFVAKIDEDTGAMEWELSYAGFESAVTEAHIHFGQPGVNGGLIALLCSNLGGGAPTCPATEGMVSGLIDELSIIGPADQGIETGELREALMAILSDVTYVNVHSEVYPAEQGLGEIRGQLRRGYGGGRDRDSSGDNDDPETEGTAVDRNRGNDKEKDNNKGKDKDKDKDKGDD